MPLISSTPFGSICVNQTCEQFGTITFPDTDYKLQNNLWGLGSPITEQCVCAIGTNGFSVDFSNHNKPTTGAPAAFPSVFKGCHWGDCTTASGFPFLGSSITTADFSWQFNPIGTGAWNAVVEAWFKTNATPGQPDGAEIMLWFDDLGGPVPGGTQVDTAVSLDGATWDVYFTNATGSPSWNFVTYKRTTLTTTPNVDLLPFFTDAVNRGYLNLSWYMLGVEAGFEIWQGGAGLSAPLFTIDVS